MTEHLRAVDVNISERTATAMLYAIKSDTLFFNRQTNRVDIEAFSYLYPLADAALIRKMEGSEITVERLEYVIKAYRSGILVDQVFCGFVGPSPREDFIPYVADFFLQLENVKWTVIAGIVNDALVISVRNLGYTKNAGEFVRRFFADVGSAGGHRAMAKAIVPMQTFRTKFGDLQADAIAPRLHQLVEQFRHEAPREGREGKEGKSLKSEVKSEEEAKVR
jgi:nanoRNase/pAp phosphatase (c-di-AMP/oligoRNAs hydrolase)